MWRKRTQPPKRTQYCKAIRCANYGEDHLVYAWVYKIWQKEKGILKIKYTKDILFPETRKLAETKMQKDTPANVVKKKSQQTPSVLLWRPVQDTGREIITARIRWLPEIYKRIKIRINQKVDPIIESTRRIKPVAEQNTMLLHKCLPQKKMRNYLPN